jgi:rod shape-determining protein MreD
MRTLRLAAAILALGIIQIAVFPHLRVADAVPDLGLVFAVAVAYREGPELGAMTGFFSGLWFDLFLETPLGLSALTYALTAYAVGVLQTGMMREPIWMPPLLGAASGFAGGLLFLAIGGLVGVDGLWTTHALAIVSAAALYDAVLAPIIFPLATRLLGDDDRRPASLRTP